MIYHPATHAVAVLRIERYVLPQRHRAIGDHVVNKFHLLLQIK